MTTQKTFDQIPIVTDPSNDLPPFPLESEFSDDLAFLRHMDPRHPETQKFIDDLNCLTKELGCRPIDPKQIWTPTEEDIPEKGSAPEGFRTSENVRGGSTIELPSLRDEILCVADQESDEVDVDVQILETSGVSPVIIRYVDLRPIMTNQVQKAGSKSAIGRAKLDRTSLRLVRDIAEGKHVDSVKGHSKIRYGKAPGQEMGRVYMMLVKDEQAPEGVLTVARLADSVGTDGQRSLYRRIFGQEMGKK